MSSRSIFLSCLAAIVGGLGGSGSYAQDGTPSFDPVGHIDVFGRDVGFFSMSADGGRFAFCGAHKRDDYGGSRIVVYDVLAEKPLFETKIASSWALPADLRCDGKLLAYATRDGVLHLVEVDSGREVETLADPDGVVSTYGQLTFSPDGRSLWAWYDGPDARPSAVLAWDVATKRVVSRFLTHDIHPRTFSLFPDNRRVAVGYRNGDLQIWDSQTATSTVWQTGERPEPPFTDVPQGEFKTVTVSPDGRHLLSGVMSRDPVLWDATTGKIAHRFSTSGQPRNDLLGFDPGSRVAICQGRFNGDPRDTGDDYPLHVFDVRSGKRLAYLKLSGTGVLVPDCMAHNLGWGDKGRRLYVALTSGKVAVFETEAWLKEMGKPAQ